MNLFPFRSQYPDVLKSAKYEPQSSIRGLHYDIDRGLMLKIDQFNNIQLGTVYRGKKKLHDQEVKKLYGRLRLPWRYVEGVRGIEFILLPC